MNRIDSSEARLATLSDAEFKDRLAGAITHLRAFGRSLSGNRDIADDLVQETMLKAWAARGRFEAGTNFKAWTTTILRNVYFSQTRRNRFAGEWSDLVADRVLAAPASQDKSVELRDLMRALQQISPDQREALILVVAAGMAYEEVAEITGVAVGTVKSRVSRARLALEELINGGVLQTKRQDFGSAEAAVTSLFAYLDTVQARYGRQADRDEAGMLQIAA
ncbi:sigma-70 family RNA polymerase sigma factor [Sphingomonas sp. OTU376]|uniref:sigma-70 family RNA polymerase sigma factor n=1 Tax=Sphingomonas sp. OTU376 TaxID=3043863 RepID=UPI00313C68A3